MYIQKRMKNDWGKKIHVTFPSKIWWLILIVFRILPWKGDKLSTIKWAIRETHIHSPWYTIAKFRNLNIQIKGYKACWCLDCWTVGFDVETEVTAMQRNSEIFKMVLMKMCYWCKKYYFSSAIKQHGMLQHGTFICNCQYIIFNFCILNFTLWFLTYHTQTTTWSPEQWAPLVYSHLFLLSVSTRQCMLDCFQNLCIQRY